MILFSVLYGVISFRFRYWGEMMTYLGMSLPMAVWSAVTWLKNPSAGNGSEVAIRRLEKRQALIVAGLSVLVTGAFYFILRWFRTPNLAFSTVSVTTGLLAAALTMLRSLYYALGCAANDLVLVVPWSLAAMKDPVYAPVVVNFAIFFLNGSVRLCELEKAGTAPSRVTALPSACAEGGPLSPGTAALFALHSGPDAIK